MGQPKLLPALRVYQRHATSLENCWSQKTPETQGYCRLARGLSRVRITVFRTWARQDVVRARSGLLARPEVL